MILAAGFGTRMGALTRSTPKPLLMVGGRTLIDHALDRAQDAGAARVVINLHYLGDQIQAHLARRTIPSIVYSNEQPEILDTGGGIVKALPDLADEPFHVLNSDAVFVGPNPLVLLADAWQTDLDCLMLLVPRHRAIAYTRPGDFFLEQDGTPPLRRSDASQAPMVYTGAQILSPRAMADVPDGAFSLNLIWDRLISAGRLAAITYRGTWIDVGTPDGLGAADAALREVQ